MQSTNIRCKLTKPNDKGEKNKATREDNRVRLYDSAFNRLSDQSFASNAAAKAFFGQL